MNAQKTASPPIEDAPSARPVIEVSGLTKAYRTYKKQPGFLGALKGLAHREYEQVLAASDVSFAINEGELVGFLGPNGAGKTTTLKMLAGLLHPTSGSARVLGYVPWEREDGYRRQFALLLGQKNQLWWDLPARESLELNAKIYGIPKTTFDNTVSEMAELLNVKDKMNVMVRELSLGERMKMELIAALLHQPKVLFLDEPTIGLDVVSQKTVREFLRQHNATRKTTVLLTSHYMTDIQELCQRVIIIDRGKIFFVRQTGIQLVQCILPIDARRYFAPAKYGLGTVKHREPFEKATGRRFHRDFQEVLQRFPEIIRKSHIYCKG